ncbi:reverse transcriptase domain-containing protein [Tanacetum coccineum]
MADNRTMAQMLQAPIERYEDAIVVPPINANNFELKQPLINLVQSNKFTGRQDPHNHLRFFNKVTSTLRHPEVPNTSIKLLLFPFSLDGEARDWLDKEPPRSILTWDDLVSKFINQFFPPSKTTYLLTEITTSPTKTTKPSTNKGTFKRILRQYKMPRDGLAIIESKSKVRYSRSRPNDSRAITNAPSSPSNNSFEIQQMAALFEDKMNIRMSRFEKEISEKNATTPATVKAVKEVCVTCGSNHNFNHCLRASTEKVQNPNLENTAHVPPPEEEDSIFIEIPKPKAKKTVNVEIQDLNSPRPNSYPSKLPYPERMKVRENDKPSAQHSRFLKMFKQLRLEIGLKIALASGSFEDLGKISYPCALQKPSIGLVLSHSKASINFYTSFYLTRTTWLEALTPTRRMTPSLPIVPFAPDGYRQPFLRTARALIDVYDEKLILRDGNESLTLNMQSEKSKLNGIQKVESINMIDIFNVPNYIGFKDLFAQMYSGSPTIQSNDSFPSSSPMKTRDSTFEEFTDEFTLPNSLPPGDDVSILKKDFQEDTSRIISNPLFEFNDNFKSSNVNPLFEENDKDSEVTSSSSFTLTSPEENVSIPPGIDLTIPPTLKVSSSNPTSPTLTGEKVCSWKTPMFFSLIRFVWKMMTRIAIRKKIICLLATYLHKNPKLLSRPQEVKEIKEKEDEVSSEILIHTIVMPIRITFDNPIDFNHYFSKTKDLKKDLTISFDSTTESSILPPPLLDSDSPFTAELSASVILNSLRNGDKVFKPDFKEPSFLLPPPEPPDACLKNVVLNFHQNQKTFPLNVEDVNSFAFIIWTFLPFFTYTKESPLIFSFKSENFVFDLGIITFHNPVDSPNKFFEVSRVWLIYPILLELLILCVNLVWGDPYPFIISINVYAFAIT